MSGNRHNKPTTIQLVTLLLLGALILGSFSVPVSAMDYSSKFSPVEQEIEFEAVHNGDEVNQILTVGENQSYNRLQTAIDEANPGDTIQVGSGEYYPIFINKEVKIIGINTGNGKPVIDAGETEQCIRIRNRADDVVIEGFYLKGDDKQGVHFVQGTDRAKIVNNTFEVEIGFVFAPESSDHVIYGNDFAETHKIIASYSDAIATISLYWNSTEPVSYWWEGERRVGKIGNYYGDRGTDENKDGIGDEMHELNLYPWKNTDQYPLVDKPWKYFEEGVGKSPDSSRTLTPVEETPSTEKDSSSETPVEESGSNNIEDSERIESTSFSPTTTPPTRGFFSNSAEGPAFLNNIFNLTVLGFVLSVAGMLQQMKGGR